MENSGSSTPWYAESVNADKPLLEQARDKTQDVLQQGQQKAGQMMDQARTQVMSQLEGQKEKATGGLENVAQALRQAGQQLRNQDQGAIGQYAEGAADAVERFSGYLRERDVQQMINGVENFARREPALFLGSMFALGFLAARFLKSSSSTASSGATYRTETRASSAPPASAQRLADQMAAPDAAPDVDLPVGAAPISSASAMAPPISAAESVTADVGRSPASVDVDEESDLVPAAGSSSETRRSDDE